MKKQTNIIDAALWYARHGLAVFPLHSPIFDEHGGLAGCSCGYVGDGQATPDSPKHAIGKHPRTAQGVKEATTDSDQVRRWWETWPDANIGLHCGAAGVVALDLDSYKGEYAGGDLLSLEEQETVTALTGGGGTHLLYAMPDGVRLGNERGDLPAGVDVRGWGGYIVLPPSLHPSGRRYSWEEGYRPNERALLPLPGHIVTLIQAAAKRRVLGGAVAVGGHAVGAPVNLSRWNLPEKVLHLIGRGNHSDRSRADWIVCKELVKAGATDGEIVEIFHTQPIGTMGKLASKNGHGDAYLGMTISKARAEVEGEQMPQSTVSHLGLAGDGRVEGAVEDGDGAQEGKQREKIADRICTLALENAEMFMGQDGEAYAFCYMEGRRECYRLSSGQFSDFLTALFYRRFRTIPGAQQKADALAILRWNARETSRNVFVRVGSHDGKVYIDLGSSKWDAIEVDSTGWRVVDVSPIAFRRPKGMKQIPYPTPCHKVDLLRDYLNIEPEHWPMLAAWVVAALNAKGPYPVLVFAGEQGTAKSTSVRVLKSLIDPSSALLRGQPNEVRDLMVGASNSWLLAFDNVSVLHPDVSDALCMISTGGGYAKRALFTDDGELLIDVTRPVAVNGIGDVVTRPDLMDRCILLLPPTIPDAQRRDETAFWEAFERDRPLILGAFLTALSVALRELPNVQLGRLPRMADFAKLAVAAESALRTDGGLSFGEAYRLNREEATEIVIESSPLGDKLRELVLVNGKWEGTATQLLAALNEKATDSERRAKSWPAAANKLKTPLQRLAPSLRATGVGVEYDRGRGASRIVLTRLVDAEWK